MNIKVIALLYFCLGCSTAVFSQSEKKDIIYLKNGSIIKGTIIEQIPGKSYKILTSDNNTFTYVVDEIEKITSEVVTPPVQYYTPPAEQSNSKKENYNNTKKEKNEPQFKTNGWSGILRLGPLGLRSYTATAIVGNNLNGFLFLGLGTSLDAYKNIGEVDLPHDYPGMDVLLPAYVDVRMFASEKRFAFMWHLDMGYSALLNSTIRYQNDIHSMDSYDKTSSGGLYYGTGVGLRVFVTDKTAILLEFGLKIQNFSLESYQTSAYYGNGIYSYKIDNVERTNKIAATPYFNIGLKF